MDRPAAASLTPKFSPSAKARITERITRVLGCSLIGDTERLAGIEGDEARRAFWWPFLPIARANPDNVQPYIDAGMAECHRIIAAVRTQWVAL